MTGAPFLELAQVTAGYGAITVLDGLSLRLQRNEVLAILGANGSGKSTVLKTAIGLTRMIAGRLSFADQDITRLPAHRRAALGIGYVPQNQNVFADLTVLDNLRWAASCGPRHSRPRSAPCSSCSRGSPSGGANAPAISAAASAACWRSA